MLVDAHIGESRWRLGSSALTLLRVEVVSDGDEIASVTASATCDIAAAASFHAAVPPVEGPEIDVLLGARSDFPQSSPRARKITAEALWRDLVEGVGPFADETVWYLLAVDDDGGPLATGWALRRYLTGDDEPELAPALARAVAVLALEDYEPVCTPDDPTTVVAGIEPEPGFTLGIQIDPSAEVTAAQVVTAAPDGVDEGPIESGLSLVDAYVADGHLVCTAAVRAVGAEVPAETLGGMVDAVLDVARSLTMRP